LSRSVLNPVRQVFKSPRALWACEFTSRHVIVAGVDSSRKRIAGRAVEPLPLDAIRSSLSGKNLIDVDAVRDITKDAIRRAGVRGFEMSVVIPDDSSRIALVTAENLPSKTEDREAFLRWKLKKTVPFEVETAQIAYQILGPHEGKNEKGVDIMVALSPRAIIQDYEELLERLDIHAGYVVPSTIAAMNLRPEGGVAGRAEDVLFVKVAPDSIATTVFQNFRPRFYRRVAEMPLYDAVYPTMMYYQDKLGGTTLSSATVCGYDTDLHSEMEELEDRLNVVVRGMEPRNTEDIYKPALGAVGFVWANLI
jgi:Tfp pilus assembly PilM family ATPase